MNTKQKLFTLANQNVPIPFDKFSTTLFLRKTQKSHLLKFRTEIHFQDK